MDRRHTIQRDIILNTVRDLAKHSTVDEIYEEIHKNYQNIGKGTVYRNLNILAEEGLIRKVEIPNGPDIFDHTCEDHYHVRCIKCGEVSDVQMDVIPDLMGRINDRMGVEFIDFDILFKGICVTCKGQE